MKVSSPEKQKFSPETNASTQRMEKKRRFCFDLSAGSIHHLNIPSPSKYASSYWEKSTYNFPFTPTFSIQKEYVQIPHLPYFHSRRLTQHKVMRRKGRRRNRKLMLKKNQDGHPIRRCCGITSLVPPPYAYAHKKPHTPRRVWGIVCAELTDEAGEGKRKPMLQDVFLSFHVWRNAG